MGWITLENMEFHANHGFFKEEQIIGNTFNVHIKIKTNLKKAAQSDSLEDTVNYQRIYELTKKEMETRSKLLEHIAHRILNAIKTEFEQIERIKVKIAKNNPPVGGKLSKVCVEMKG